LVGFVGGDFGILYGGNLVSVGNPVSVGNADRVEQSVLMIKWLNRILKTIISFKHL